MKPRCTENGAQAVQNWCTPAAPLTDHFAADGQVVVSAQEDWAAKVWHNAV